MISSGVNLVMTVIGFVVSCVFIVFVCTRLICARFQHLHFHPHPTSIGSDLERGSRGGIHGGLHPTLLANFPTNKFKDLGLPSNSKQDAQCTVCLSEYCSDETIRILPACGHSFHAACIDTWLLQHSTCPVCRISLRELPHQKPTWLMQPIFCSPVRSQNGSIADCIPRCGSHEETRVTAVIKDLQNPKVASPSAR